MTDKTDSKERDLMELIDAYAEARHIGGCHTYNAKTAEARAKVVASLAASAGMDADMRAVVAVAVTMLFDSHPEDVRRTFTIAELSDMVRITEALGNQQVEDIYKRVWDGTFHPSPPEGMVMVPKEPTMAMRIAAKTADMDHTNLSDWMVSDWPEFKRIWDAMLKAAPPTTSAGSGKGE